MELASRMIVSEKFEGLLERRRQGLKIRNGIVDEILKAMMCVARKNVSIAG